MVEKSRNVSIIGCKSKRRLICLPNIASLLLPKRQLDAQWVIEGKLAATIAICEGNDCIPMNCSVNIYIILYTKILLITINTCKTSILSGALLRDERWQWIIWFVSGSNRKIIVEHVVWSWIIKRVKIINLKSTYL